MSTTEITKPPTTKPVYILPRLRLSSGKYGQKEVRLGKAEFWPDDDASWSNIVGKPRPPWLDIFRDFPGVLGNKPNIVRGTLLLSADHEWLREHAPKAVPLLFVLSLDAGRWETPAEAFHYMQYDAKAEPSDLVSLATKYGPVMEDATSLQLFPPLGLRCQRSVQVRMDEPFKGELVRRFEQNPNDRIVVACRHLFRTQFSDPFIAPFDQDEAAYCSCLEAVFGIESSQREIGKELGKRVAAAYPDLDGLHEWIQGLYIRRCDFDHGDSGSNRQYMPQHKVLSYENFKKRKGYWTVLRGLCLDLIRREAERTMTSPPSLRFCNEEAALVRAYFRSDKLWTCLNKQFSIPNAGKVIHGLREGEKTKFHEVVEEFIQGHRWECMTELPQLSRVVNVLKSAVVTLLNCPDSEQGEKDDALAVSRAAKAGEVESVRLWVDHHEEWETYGWAERLMSDHIKSVILHIARYFKKLK